MFQERVVARLPAVEAFAAEKTGDIVGESMGWVEVEACVGELPKAPSVESDKGGGGGRRTLAGAICLCGQPSALPRPLAVEPLFFAVFWNEARRASRIMY